MERQQHDAAAEMQMMNQLKKTFEKLPNDIPIYMFTEKGREDMFADATRQIIRTFRQLSSKITFREYNLTHELAK